MSNAVKVGGIGGGECGRIGVSGIANGGFCSGNKVKRVNWMRGNKIRAAIA